MYIIHVCMLLSRIAVLLTAHAIAGAVEANAAESGVEGFVPSDESDLVRGRQAVNAFVDRAGVFFLSVWVLGGE